MLILCREELKEKFEGRLSRDCSGSTYEVMGTIMKAMVNRKITIPGNFTGYIKFSIFFLVNGISFLFL